MAANPSDDVSTIEHEVEEARERLAGAIAKLSDPATHQAVKDEVMGYVEGYKEQLLHKKDELIDDARAAVTQKAQGVVADLKQRAMNNPVAVAMIGAGIAYRLYRHPPLTTLLVGGGIALMMRGRGRAMSDRAAYRAPYDGEQPRGYVPGGVAGYGYPVEEDAPGSTTTERMMRTASEYGEKARDAAYQAKDRISEAAERAGSAAYDGYERTREAAMEAYERSRSTAYDAYGRVGDAAYDARERAAGAYDSVRTSPLALGAIGVVAGAALAAAIRSTETGDRFIGATGDAVGRSARGLGSGARYAGRRMADTASGMASTVASAAAGAAGTVTSAASGLADTASDLASSVASAASGMAGRLTGGDEDEYAEDRRRSARGARSGGPQRAGRRRPSPREEEDEGLMSSVSGAASSAYRSAAEQAEWARRRSLDLGSRTAGQVSELAQEYPLLLGTIGLALGAAAGLMMRPTETEDELIGSYSDALKARARDMADEQYRSALGMADELAEGLRQPAASSGSGDGRDRSADWETVIGGGAPPTAGARPGNPGAGPARG
jgi:hypothetical protein